MHFSKTDTDRLLRLLTACAKLIDTNCDKACQQDKARQCRQFVKLIRKRQ